MRVQSVPFQPALLGCVLLIWSGCKDRDDVQLSDSATVSAACIDGPTWHGEVHPILHQNCINCHATGEIAEQYGDWSTYEGTQPMADLIAHEVSERQMPPFIAQDSDDCSPRFDFMHDARLSDEDITILQDWAQCGEPLGDASNPAPLVDPDQNVLVDWDVSIKAPEPYQHPAVIGDTGRCWSIEIPPEWFAGGEDVLWVDAMEVIPGNTAIDHHILVQIHDSGLDSSVTDSDRSWDCTGAGIWGGLELGGYLPGAPPSVMPAGAALPIYPDSRIGLNIHYHVTDLSADLSDHTELRLRLTDAPIYEPLLYRVGNFTTAGQGLQAGPNDLGGVEFRIPSGVSGHTETMIATVPGVPGNEFTTFVLSNHAHLLGTNIRSWVIHDPQSKAPDEPLEECLLSTPRYDFDWQGFFYYDAAKGEGPRIRAGDQIKIECVFDNTHGNKAWVEELERSGVPTSPLPDVYYGTGSLDEMCVVLVGAIDLEP